MIAGLKLKLLLGAVVAGILYLGYRHYVGLVDQVGQLQADKARLETELAVQGATIDEQAQALMRWREEAQQQAARLEEQRRIAETASAEARRLNDIFAEHDLTRLTLAKPGLIENRINAGTRDVGRMLQCASTPGGCDDE